MTFTQTVKGEILKNNQNLVPCCKTVCLSCFIRTIGAIDIDSKGFGFSLASENLSLLKFILNIIEKLFGCACEISQENGGRRKNHSLYRLTVDESEKILFECGVLSVDAEGCRQINETIEKEMLADDCCEHSFVTALFLGAGSVLVPEKNRRGEGYHLEFSINNESLANQLFALLEKYTFKPKKLNRKNETLIYFKDSEEISDLLVFMNVTKAVFKLQNTIVERSVRNNVNRQTNCISANIDKVVEAAEKQIAAIKIIEFYGGLSSLPDKLRKSALLRIQNPSESLDELVVMSDEPVTKSGLNHRFRRIIEIAGEISKREEKHEDS